VADGHTWFALRQCRCVRARGQARATSEVSHPQCVACQAYKVLGSIARLFLFRLGLCGLVPAVHCAIHPLPTSSSSKGTTNRETGRQAIDIRLRLLCRPLPIATFDASTTWLIASRDARTIPNAAILHRQQWSHAPKRRTPGPLLVPCSLKKTKHTRLADVNPRCNRRAVADRLSLLRPQPAHALPLAGVC
jgi:hypothetical protein